MFRNLGALQWGGDCAICANVPAVKLSAVFASLEERGIAEVHGDEPSEGQALAEALGRADPREILRGSVADAAPPSSLSAMHGRGDFPWHTDSAASESPPRYLVLCAAEVESPATRTAWLDPQNDPKMADVWGELRRAVVRVRDRRGNAFAVRVVRRRAGIRMMRWDMRAFEPVDADLAAAVQTAEPTALVEWQPGKIVVIDNWRVLHRRLALHAGENRVLHRYKVYADA